MHRNPSAALGPSGGGLLRAMLLLGGLVFWAMPVRATPGEILSSFDAPCDAPGDLAWDGLHLWLLDTQAAKVYRIDPISGAVESEVALATPSPMAIAFEGERLWIASDMEHGFTRFDLAHGEIELVLPAPRIGGSDDRVRLGGLAWADGALWSGQIAGWSSRIQRIDPSTGQVQRWFFSTGYPVAIETDGHRLWTATPTSGGDLGRIFQHDLATNDYQTHFNAPGQHTAGLAFDGRDLWCADSELRRIFRLAVR